MNTQEILTYIIVGVAVGFALYSLYKTIFPPKSEYQHGGCSSNCNCDAVKVRKELLIHKNKSN